MKNIVTIIRDTLNGLKSRVMTETLDSVKLKTVLTWTTKINRLFKKEPQFLWDNSKRSNIHVIQVPEGQEKDCGTGKVFKEIMVENFPNFIQDTNL